MSLAFGAQGFTEPAGLHLGYSEWLEQPPHRCSNPYRGPNNHMNIKILQTRVSSESPLIRGPYTPIVGSFCLCGFWAPKSSVSIPACRKHLPPEGVRLVMRRSWGREIEDLDAEAQGSRCNHTSSYKACSPNDASGAAPTGFCTRRPPRPRMQPCPQTELLFEPLYQLHAYAFMSKPKP